jgi:hypothetical protein
MVYVLWTSRTLQDTIDVLKAAKDTIQDTERITTSERSDGNVSRSFQLAENQVEAAFLSLQVRPSLLFMALLHINRSLPQGESKFPNEAQDSHKRGPQDSIQVGLPTVFGNDLMLISLCVFLASHEEGVHTHQNCC